MNGNKIRDFADRLRTVALPQDVIAAEAETLASEYDQAHDTETRRIEELESLTGSVEDPAATSDEETQLLAGE